MSDRDKKLNIAVIGCGNWGKNHIRVLSELKNLYAVCDNNPSTASTYSAQYQVPAYTLDQILRDNKIDGVIIATPAHTHFNLGTACLQADKALFIEKPITLTIEDAEQLHQKAKKQNQPLMTGHLLHYHSGFQKIKELKQNGTLGKLQFIYANRFNLGKFRTEEDIWWSYAPHDISMILSLIDEAPSMIQAQEAKYLNHTVSDITTAHLKFPKGEQAHIMVSWLHPYKEQKFIVIGDKAMIVFDDTQAWESKLQLYPYPPEWQDGLPKPTQSQAENIVLEKSEPLKNQIQHFLDCISNKTTPLTDGLEAIRVMKVLTAAKQSLLGD